MALFPSSSVRLLALTGTLVGVSALGWILVVGTRLPREGNRGASAENAPPSVAESGSRRTTAPSAIAGTGNQAKDEEGSKKQPRPRVEDPEDRRLYLADLEEWDVRPMPPGWTLGKNGALGAPEGTRDQEVRVCGQFFRKGLSMHPTNSYSGCKYHLPGAKLFQSLVALNDSSRGVTGGIVFEVLGDGRSLWKSTPVDKAGVFQDCRVSVEGIKELELKVHPPEGSAFAPSQAHAVWLDPYLVK